MCAGGGGVPPHIAEDSVQTEHFWQRLGTAALGMCARMPHPNALAQCLYHTQKVVCEGGGARPCGWSPHQSCCEQRESHFCL